MYLPHLERMKLTISFIVGAENECFVPESLNRTYELLCETNGSDLYQFTQIADYGHTVCIHGKHASRVVYPHILRRLEETQ